MDTRQGEVATLGGDPATETRSSSVSVGPFEYFSRIIESVGLSGVVTTETALKQSVVYACVKVLSEAVGKVPFRVYRQTGPQTYEEIYAHPLNQLLTVSPNNWQTPFELHEFVLTSMLLRGNGYIYLPKMSNGTPTALVPVHPDHVQLNTLTIVDPTDPPDPIYTVTGANRPLSRYNLMHVRLTSRDGYMGLSPIHQGAEAIGISVNAEKRLSRIFSNRVGNDYKMEVPNKLDKEQFERLRKQIEDTYGQGKDIPLVSEEGARWSLISMTARDAQLLENRKFQVEDIARIFRVPLHKIQVEDAERNATGTSVEVKNTTFLDDAIVPHLTRLEQAYTLSLLDTEDRRGGLCIKADTSEFARADMKSRYESYRIGLGGGANPGFLSVNDIRRKEKLPMLPDEVGDVYYVPLNVTEAGQQQEETQDEN